MNVDHHSLVALRDAISHVELARAALGAIEASGDTAVEIGLAHARLTDELRGLELLTDRVRRVG